MEEGDDLKEVLLLETTRKGSCGSLVSSSVFGSSDDVIASPVLTSFTNVEFLLIANGELLVSSSNNT